MCDDGFGSLGWFESVSCEFNQILCEFNAINQMTRPEMLCNYTFMWCAVSSCSNDSFMNIENDIETFDK